MLRVSRVHRLSILLALLPAAALAADRRYDYREKVLDNGLTVLTLEDHSSPIVAVQVWYHVGSKDEDPQRQGFAHMFEHMMFRGTDKLGSKDHFDFIRRTGGDCNAYTAFDNTTYINELPSNQLELILWLEAERMAFLRVDEKGFHDERKVVEEERRMRSLNAPYGMVPERLLAEVFTVHPYRWTPIGQIPHLRAATIEELQAFWDKYYVPANATLVIVGDVTHDKAHELADRYFGWIPKMPAPPRVTVKEPAQTEKKVITIPEKKGPIPIVGVVYRGVPTTHPDALPLEMLMNILGGGESSRIYKDLVKDKRICQVAVGGSVSFEDDGLFGAGAAVLPLVGDKAKVITEIRGHLERARSEKVSDRELEKVKNQYLRSTVTESLTVASKATMLGTYKVLHGNTDEANRQLDKIRAITADDLLRVAQTYIRPEAEITATVQPQAGGLASLFGSKKDDVDEGAAPLPEPETNRVAPRGGERAQLARPAAFPEAAPKAALLESFPEPKVIESKLQNGMKLVVIPNHEVPFVTISLGSLHGAWTEGKPGSASMACGLITKGSADHTAAEMAEELEFNAISLGAGADMDTTTVSASCVSDKLPVAMKLMAEVVRTPTFPEDEFNVLRDQTKLGLSISNTTPEYVAEREMRSRLFGEHPYSRTPTGELEDVGALTVADAKAWWSRYIRHDSCVLYVAGDVQPSEVAAMAEQHFGGWTAEENVMPPALPPVPQPSATHIYLVDRPGSVQSQIRMGHIGITRHDKAYFPSRVLSTVFGGGFNSRLNDAVRVQKGLTYGARGGLSSDRFAGRLGISTFTKTPSTVEAVKVILGEIEKIRSEPITAEELDVTRSYILGGFAGDRETPQATVGDMWLIEREKLPKDYFRKYLSGIRDTTPEAVLQVAKMLIRPDQLTIVVVGEAKVLREELEKIAPVTVIGEDTPSSRPTPPAAPATPEPAKEAPKP
jgi:zinc protease